MPKYAYLFLASLFFHSCDMKENYCEEYGKYEIQAIQNYLDRKITTSNTTLVPASEFKSIIQYNGYESGAYDFDHVIRIIEVDQKHLIQLYHNERVWGPGNYRNSFFFEKVLHQEDFNKINLELKKLTCGPIKLDQITASHLNYFSLLVKLDHNTKLFSWHFIQNQYDTCEVLDRKNQIGNIVSLLMKMAHFPIPKKMVVRNRYSKNMRQLEYAIFPSNFYTSFDYRIFYKDRELALDKDGVAKVIVRAADSLDIKNQISIQLEMLDRSIVNL